MSGETALFYFFLPDKKAIFRYKSLDHKLPIIVKNIGGLVGSVLEAGEIIETGEPQKSTIHNPSIDIQTNLPLLTGPVKNTANEIVAFYQVINLKSNIERNQGRAASLDSEIIKAISFFAAHAIETLRIRGKEPVLEF
jgi:hypothetical protein